MRTQIRSPVQVSKVTVFAELAQVERRPELQHLFAAAAQRGGDGLTPELIELTLPGLTTTAQRNLVRHCEYLGLCDGQGRLRAAGHECARTGEVPIPEQGIYSLWLVEHPLCGPRLLHVERERGDARDLRFSENVAAPSALLSLAQQVWTSVIDRQLRFVLRKLPAAERTAPQARVVSLKDWYLVWDIDFLSGKCGWRLQGNLPANGKVQAVETAPEPVTDFVPLEAFGLLEPRWNHAHRRVALPFDQLPPDGETFRRELRYPAVEWSGRGRFTDVVVKDVPVEPTDVREAQRWAEALLARRLREKDGYWTPQALWQLFSELVLETPLESFRPRLQPHHEALQQLDSPMTRRRFWLQAAPVDLSPVPISAALLEPLIATRRGDVP